MNTQLLLSKLSLTRTSGSTMSRNLFRTSLASAAVALGLVACSGTDGNNGKNGESTLVAVVSVPAGANCANGGVAIEQGLDANGNGMLDASEVIAAETVYVCNGAAGQADAGAAGENALVSVSTEPPGANCANGGQRIDSGLDLNGDGTLEANEITSTRYVCNGDQLNGYHFGDLYISTAADVAQLSGVNHLVGSLYINATIPSAISLPSLIDVSGSIQATSEPVGDRQTPHHHGRDTGYSVVSGVTGLDLPSLVRVGGLYVYGISTLTSLNLPALTQASIVEIAEMDGLTALALPGLTQVFSELEINYMQLTSLDLSHLASVGYLQLENVDVLTTLSAPALTTANAIDIEGDSALTSVSMPKLASASNYFEIWDMPNAVAIDVSALAQAGSVYLGELPNTSLSLPALVSVSDEVEIYQNSLLTSVSLPLWVSGDLDLEYNSVLPSISLPKYTQAHYLTVDGNPVLPYCAVLALYEQMNGAPGYNINNNDNTDTSCTLPAFQTYSVPGISDTLEISLGGYAFDDAEAACKALGTGAHLFWFESAAELAALHAQALLGGYSDSVWLGYTDATDANVGSTTTEGTWVALSGATAYNPLMPVGNAAYWEPGEPNGGTGENCSQYYNDGLGNDVTCSNGYQALCRIPPQASRGR